MAGTFGTRMRDSQREVERNKEKQGRSDSCWRGPVKCWGSPMVWCDQEGFLEEVTSELDLEDGWSLGWWRGGREGILGRGDIECTG